MGIQTSDRLVSYVLMSLVYDLVDVTNYMQNLDITYFDFMFLVSNFEKHE